MPVPNFELAICPNCGYRWWTTHRGNIGCGSLDIYPVRDGRKLKCPSFEFNPEKDKDDL